LAWTSTDQHTMADSIATSLAKRYFIQLLLNNNRFIGERVGNYFKRDDPYFEATEDTPGVLTQTLSS
jgi:hypothetical protein